MQHFKNSIIKTVKDSRYAACKSADSIACMHRTFIAGIMSAQHASSAPAIGIGCKLLLYLIFSEEAMSSINNENEKKDKNNNFPISVPSSNPKELSTAIIETVDAGAN